MTLPPGFTGFHGPHLQTEAPFVDLSHFKTGCHAAARALDGRVAAFREAQITPSFHQAVLEWDHGNRTVVVLCNRHHWLVALSAPLAGCVITFIDEPVLQSELQRLTGWRVLSKAELETPLTEMMLATLAPGDRYAIETARRKKWFSPARTVGDVIFHFWD